MPLSIMVAEVYLFKAVKQSICHRIKWNASLENNGYQKFVSKIILLAPTDNDEMIVIEQTQES